MDCNGCISVKEACNLFEVSRWTLRRTINNAKINGHPFEVHTSKVGRETKVCRLDLNDVFERIQYGPPVRERRSKKEKSEAFKVKLKCKNYILEGRFPDLLK